MLNNRVMVFLIAFLVLVEVQALIEAGNVTSCNSECAFTDVKAHLSITSHVIEAIKQKISEFKIAPTEENHAINNSECLIADIMSHLGIASQSIETIEQKMSKDLKQICRNCKENDCKKCKDIICSGKPLDCSDIYLNGERKDGLYDIWPQGKTSEYPLRVYCDMESNGGGWMVIQRRGDYGQSQDYFYKDWNAYKIGFGNKLEDFWIGNDNLFALTNQRRYELRVNLTAWEGLSAYATYNQFSISDEKSDYTLHVAGYNGTAGNSLTHHNGSSFTTKDRENAKHADKCAAYAQGAWWYGSTNCVYSNLNGLYLRGDNSEYDKGVVWYHFKGGYHSLRDTVMKIRPLRFWS